MYRDRKKEFFHDYNWMVTGRGYYVRLESRIVRIPVEVGAEEGKSCTQVLEVAELGLEVEVPDLYTGTLFFSLLTGMYS